MPNYLPRAGAAVRALRESFANGTAHWRGELAKVLNDPDLTTEARTRKAETLRATLAAEANAALAQAREEVAKVTKVRVLFDPAILRRRAVMQDPARAAALREVFAALAPAELEAFASEALAMKDEVATFALLAAIGSHPHAAGDARLAATAAKLSAPLDDGSTRALADHVVAEKELALLELADVPHARGERPDLTALMARLDTIQLSRDDHATEYRAIGLSPAAPKAVSSGPPLVHERTPVPASMFADAA